MSSSLRFNQHPELAGRHSFLSASQYHWVNYEDEKLKEKYANHLNAMRGSQLHEFAHTAIGLGIKLPRTNATLNLYVNDAIGFRMQSEVVLYYSENAFGTADCISFRYSKALERMVLRIHDLKNGLSPVSFKQLEVYAAYFCLEYKVKPGEIDIYLRLYYKDEMEEHIPDVEEIIRIMDRIVTFDTYIQRMKEEAFS